MRLILKGSSGADVKKWQEFLLAKKYKLGGYGADGKFGSATEKDTKAYQLSEKLIDDGIVGKLTIESAKKYGWFETIKTFTRRIDDIVAHITATSKLPVNYKQYHWLVDGDGKLIKGRDESIISATVLNYNSYIIGFSYIARGNDYDSEGKYGKYFVSKAQQESYEKLTADIIYRHKLTILTDLKGHNDYTNRKACPCFRVHRSEEYLDNVAYWLRLYESKVETLITKTI